MCEGERPKTGSTETGSTGASSAGASSAGASNAEDDDSAHAAFDTAPIDLDEIARLVYQLMLKDLAIGRERGE